MERFINCYSTIDSSCCIYCSQISINGKKNEKNQENLRACVEAVEQENIDDNNVQKYEIENDQNQLEIVEDLSDKFIVPGGWFGVALVCLPITAISLYLLFLHL